MHRFAVVFALLFLAACGPDPGEACEATGDGFTRRDPCDHTCVEWDVACSDGSTVVPGVCSGVDCTNDPGVCGPGSGCAPINMTDSACLPLSLCPGGFSADALLPADPWDLELPVEFASR